MQSHDDVGVSDGGHLGVLAIGRHSVAYAFGGLAYKGVALVSVPLLARLLSPAELGLLDLAAVLATLLGLAAGFGTEQGVAFFEPTASDEGEIWDAALTVVTSLSALFAVGCLVFQEPLAHLLTGNRDNSEIVAAAGLYAGSMAATALALNAIRLRGSPRAYATISFLVVTIESVGAVSVALLLRDPVVWMVLAWTLGSAFVVVPVLVRYLPRPRRPRWATILNLARFGLPLVPVAIAWLVGDAWMRATLARDADLSSLGEYGIAYRLTSVMSLAVAGFGVAWYPYLYRAPAAEVGSRFHAVGPSVLLAIGTMGVGLTALAPEVVDIVAGQAYAAAGTAVPALSGGMVALAAFVLTGAIVGRSGSTRRVGGAALIGMGVQIVAATTLIEPLGVGGASLASLAGYSVAAVVLLSSERWLLAGRGGIGFVTAAAWCGLGLGVSSQSFTQPIGIRFAMVVGFAMTAVLLARRLQR